MALEVFLMAENLSGWGVFLDKTGGFFSSFASRQYTTYSLPTTFAVHFFGYAKVKAWADFLHTSHRQETNIVRLLAK